MKYLIFFLTCLAVPASLLAQQTVDWKYQVTQFVDDYNSPTPADNNHYNWSQETVIDQGIHINMKPTEDAKIYVEADNAHINFTWSDDTPDNNEPIKYLAISVNNSSGSVLYNGSGVNHVTWNCSYAFDTPGYYDLEVLFKKGSNPLFKLRQYKIYVVPKSDELHRDQHKNSIRVWKSDHPNAKPFLVSVGLDAHNVLPEQFQRHDVSSLFDCLLEDQNNPHDVYVLYYRYNPQNLRNNAAVFASAVNYVSNTKYSGKKIIAGGRSMGGIISRYALAKAEEDGAPLPVTTWFTLDSPHKGAHIPPAVLDYFKELDKEFLNKLSDNDAAKTMLNYNPFNPSGSVQATFYNEINNLNGDGFPHLTHNIGIAFSNPLPNPESGLWLAIVNLLAPIGPPNQSFTLQPEDKIPGSYLPRMDIDPRFAGIFSINQFKNPTFMDYKSALDIDDTDSNTSNDLANSRFDVHVAPATTMHHNIFPSEIATLLATEIVAATNLYFQNVTVDGSGEHRAYNEIHAGDNVRTDRATGDVTVDADDITFKAGDMILMEDGFAVTDGSKFLAEIASTSTPDCTSYQFAENGDHEKGVDARSEFATNLAIDAVPNIKVYPNPVEHTATIYYDIHTEGQVSIRLSDSRGQIIKTLITAETKTPGEHQLTIDMEQLPKGMYLLHFNIKDQQYFEKVIKL